jgi:WD40 repeat protein
MEKEVLTVAYHPKGQFIVSSGQEPAFYWWNAATGERVRTLAGHGLATTEICFSRDGSLLASAGMDGKVNLCNGATGAKLKSLSIGSIVYAVDLSGDGQRLAAGSADGLVRVFDVPSNRLLATLFTVAPHDSEAEWLIATPEGYTTASDKLIRAAEWRMGKQTLPANAVWKVLGKPDAVARALSGKVPPPTFAKR